MSLNLTILHHRAVCNNTCTALILHLAVSAWFSLSLLPILNQKLSVWVGINSQLFLCHEVSMGNSSNVQSSCYWYYPSRSWKFHSLGIQARSKLWVLGFASYRVSEKSPLHWVSPISSLASPHNSSDITMTSFGFQIDGILKYLKDEIFITSCCNSQSFKHFLNAILLNNCS